jgi:hypothetical protein
MPFAERKPEPGWSEIDDLARFAGEIDVHRFGRLPWQAPQRARWRREPNGFHGWFTRSGEYLTPVPTHYRLPNGGRQ